MLYASWSACTYQRQEIEKDILLNTSGDQSRQSMWQGLSAVFRRQYRLKTSFGLVILGMIQLGGIDGVLYVSSLHGQ